MREFLQRFSKLFSRFSSLRRKTLSFSEWKLSQDMQVITNGICWSDFSCSCRSDNKALKKREFGSSTAECVWWKCILKKPFRINLDQILLDYVVNFKKREIDSIIRLTRHRDEMIMHSAWVALSICAARECKVNMKCRIKIYLLKCN